MTPDEAFKICLENDGVVAEKNSVLWKARDIILQEGLEDKLEEALFGDKND